MYKGIASKEIVVCMANAGLLGFLGTGGMRLDRIESDLRYIQQNVRSGEVYGLNLLCNVVQADVERATVELYLRQNVVRVEAAAYTQVTPDLVRFRVNGLTRRADGSVHAPRQIMAKISRPEVAEQFLNPPPERTLQKLLEAGKITRDEAQFGKSIPLASDLCVEADSGGHTDRGVAYALMPAILLLRDRISEARGYAEKIAVGASGGLGTPQAIAASFVMGADFVLTGSINQCTVEAGTSDRVKDLLQQADVQDTDIVPAGDMFEMGAKVQVFKKGLLFPTRAKKLYDLYRQFPAWEQIEEATRRQIETKYFKRGFDAVYAETKEHYGKVFPEAIARAERDPRAKMALVFRWYFVHSNRLALRGDADQPEDYQIHCGPALGSFNQWVKGTSFENWRGRHVDQIGELLMREAAKVLEERCRQFSGRF
jgi:trans-AT polyketide synthase/acyltransferase/oxidoreductase domain-containing protein